MTILFSCKLKIDKPQVKAGLDRVGEYNDLFKNQRIGIITNHTAYNSDNKHISDIFQNMPDVTVTALFGPEHGIKGIEAAGRKINDSLNTKTGIPVYSLYGKNRKPTEEMLRDIDVLIFDIQDIGSRFYTYIYTMALSMEAAAENNIKYVILDRPNPINGTSVEGNVLDTAFATFVGLYPIPVRHGMTVGELGMMFNNEGWLAGGKNADLTVIKMSAWERFMWYDQTGLPWRSPSPNIPDLNVAAVYPGMCLFEGTNVSEGRGTYQPFLRIGAPWLNLHSFEMINKLIDLDGVQFGPVTFIPKSIKSMSPAPKYMNHDVFGVSVKVMDRNTFRPYLAGIALVKYFFDANPEEFSWRVRHFDRLCGTDKIRQFIISGKSMDQIKNWIDSSQEGFMGIRSKYLLYQ